MRLFLRSAVGVILLIPLGVIGPRGVAAPDASYDPHRFLLARSQFEKGMKLLTKGMDKEGESELLSAVQTFPELVEGHIELGNLSMRRREYRDALDRYLKARDALSALKGIQRQQEVERLKHLQENIDALKERIEDLQRSQRAADAGKIQGEMVRLEKLERERTNNLPTQGNPFNSQIHFLVGTALMKLERFDEAMAEFEQALTLQPGFGEVHNNLAVIYYYRREYADSWAHVHAAELAGVRVDSQFRAELESVFPEASGP